MANFEQMVTKENGEVVIVVVKRPTNQQLKDADIQKAKVWNKAFKEGVMTKNEVEKLMKERGTWNDEKTAKERQLTELILSLERKLYLGEDGVKPKLSEGRKIAIEMKNKRVELRDLISERLSMDENTAEALADNARFDYLVYACAYDKDTDQRLFSSYDDYNSRGSSVEAIAAAQLLAKMVYNLDEDFENRLPENQFLKKFDLINESGDLINPKTKELIDIDGRKVSEEGYYLDSDGNRVDIYGKKLNSDGLYEMVEYENDLFIDETENSSEKITSKKNSKKSLKQETETA